MVMTAPARLPGTFVLSPPRSPSTGIGIDLDTQKPFAIVIVAGLVSAPLPLAPS